MKRKHGENTITSHSDLTWLVLSSKNQACENRNVDFCYLIFSLLQQQKQQLTDCKQNCLSSLSNLHFYSDNRKVSEASGRGEFSSNYDFYAGNKHENDFLYTSTRLDNYFVRRFPILHRDVLGNWKMAGKSRDTLTRRNDRATSPLISRGLDR